MKLSNPRTMHGCALLLAAGSVACRRTQAPAPAPERAPDAAPASPAPAALDAAVADAHADAGGYTDAPQTGYLRFVHVAPGLGPLRFVAVNEPGFQSSRVEVVVGPGAASAYLLAPAVPHRVRVTPAAGGAEVVASAIADVYAQNGCTTAVAGGPARRGPSARKIIAVTDYPWRTDGGEGLIRFMPAVAGGAAFNVVEDGGVVVDTMNFMEVSGIRRVAPGPHRYSATPLDGGAPWPDPLAVQLPPDVAHTLWIWGAAAHGRGPRVTGFLTRDVSPNK